MDDFLHAVRRSPVYGQILVAMNRKPGHWHWLALDQQGRVTLFHRKPWLDRINATKIWTVPRCRGRCDLPKSLPLCFLKDAQRFYLERTLYTVEELLAIGPGDAVKNLSASDQPVALPEIPADIILPDAWL